jgi:copper chaperone CopZ
VNNSKRGQCGNSEDNEEHSGPVSPGASGETFRISGMDCPEEVAAIERAVKPVSGVLNVRANLVASSVTVYHDGSVQRAELIKAIN